MFDLSWGEVMVIGAVALIVIGPKDLPKALRTVGNMTAKVRRMASEFQNQFQDAMREAELDEIRKQVEEVQSAATLNTSYNPLQTAHDELKAAVENQGAAAPAGPSEQLPAPPPADVAHAAEQPGETTVIEAIPAAPDSKPDGAKA